MNISLQIMSTIGLIFYILELAYDFNTTMNLWALGNKIKMIRYALWVSLISNGAFLTWTSIVIYRLWFQNSPQVFHSVANLLGIAVINLIIMRLRKNNLP